MRTTMMLGAAVSTMLLGVSAKAIVPRGDSDDVDECEWKFYAKSHKVKGAVTQIPDGQIQIHEYQGLEASSRFWIDYGYMYDDAARAAVVTEPQKQIQCDDGAEGADGFAVINGVLSVWGDDTIWACPINDHGDWNIYTDPLPGQLKCTAVQLHAHGNKYCKGDTKNCDNCDHQKGGCHSTCTVTQHHTATQQMTTKVTTTATVTQDCNKCQGSNCSQTCSRPTLPPKPTLPPMPTPKPCNCSQGDNPCWNKCKPPTTTLTSTSLVTVTKQKPIPCQSCHGQNNCMKTCTVVATATATTTVWKPCAEQCKGNFNCFNNCQQPRPTCGPGIDCSSWGGELHGEDWGWKPRPYGYEGYWPYDMDHKGRPEAYGGYWKGDIPKNCGDWDAEVKPKPSWDGPSMNSSDYGQAGKVYKRLEDPDSSDSDSDDEIVAVGKIPKRQEDPADDSDDEEETIGARTAGAIDEMLNNVARNATWLETHRRHFNSCVHKCDSKQDPRACHEQCVINECAGACRDSQCCTLKCSVLFPLAT